MLKSMLNLKQRTVFKMGVVDMLVAQMRHRDMISGDEPLEFGDVSTNAGTSGIDTSLSSNGIVPDRWDPKAKPNNMS